MRHNVIEASFGNTVDFMSPINVPSRYTRADGIAVIILMRSDVADAPRWGLRTPYGRVLNIGTNNDGYTKEGITFPSSEAQGALARLVLLLTHVYVNKMNVSSADDVMLRSVTCTFWGIEVKQAI